jgi:hypothetical protein
MFGARCILALIVCAVFAALYGPLLVKASEYLRGPHFERVRAAGDDKSFFHARTISRRGQHDHA